jgi:lipoprotein-anchoring transpeptidase ErfK/SrfK
MRVRLLGRSIGIAGGTLLLVSLIGCSSGALASQKAAQTSTPHASIEPTPTPTAPPTPVPAAVAPSPKPKPAAARAAAPTSPICVANPRGVKHIYVSITQQHLWACTGRVLALNTAVTTGASALTNVRDATPQGTFRIYSKVRNVVLRGHDANGSWRDPVAYWVPFYGAYGFHDASWQKFPFGSGLYRTQGSHGCVHVPVGVLGVLYKWAPIGTLVTIRG